MIYMNDSKMKRDDEVIICLIELMDGYDEIADLDLTELTMSQNLY